MLQKSGSGLHDHSGEKKKKKKTKKQTWKGGGYLLPPLLPSKAAADLDEGAWGFAQLMPGDGYPSTSLDTCSRV